MFLSKPFTETPSKLPQGHQNGNIEPNVDQDSSRRFASQAPPMKSIGDVIPPQRSSVDPSNTHAAQARVAIMSSPFATPSTALVPAPAVPQAQAHVAVPIPPVTKQIEAPHHDAVAPPRFNKKAHSTHNPPPPPQPDPPAAQNQEVGRTSLKLKVPPLSSLGTNNSAPLAHSAVAAAAGGGKTRAATATKRLRADNDSEPAQIQSQSQTNKPKRKRK